MKLTILATALAGVSFTVSASAATIHTSQAAFLATVAPGSYLETFGTAPPDYSGNGFAYSLSSPNGIYFSGSFVGTINSDDPLTITFTAGNPTAVGGEFFHSDITDTFQPGNAITITLSDGTVDTYTPATFSQFRGYTSAGPVITSLTISAPTGGTYLNVDNLIVGIAVPEPGSALLLAGALGMTLRRRRTV